MSFAYIDDAPKLLELLNDIFTDAFMAENTRFESFEGFRYSSAVIINWDAPRIVYNTELLDCFVGESTSFPSWDGMIRAAVAQRYHNKEKGSLQP